MKERKKERKELSQVVRSTESVTSSNRLSRDAGRCNAPFSRCLRYSPSGNSFVVWLQSLLTRVQQLTSLYDCISCLVGWIYGVIKSAQRHTYTYLHTCQGVPQISIGR